MLALIDERYLGSIAGWSYFEDGKVLTITFADAEAIALRSGLTGIRIIEHASAARWIKNQRIEAEDAISCEQAMDVIDDVKNIYLKPVFDTFINAMTFAGCDKDIFVEILPQMLAPDYSRIIDGIIVHNEDRYDIEAITRLSLDAIARRKLDDGSISFTRSTPCRALSLIQAAADFPAFEDYIDSCLTSRSFDDVLREALELILVLGVINEDDMEAFSEAGHSEIEISSVETMPMVLKGDIITLLAGDPAYCGGFNWKVAPSGVNDSWRVFDGMTWLPKSYPSIEKATASCQRHLENRISSVTNKLLAHEAYNQLIEAAEEGVAEFQACLDRLVTRLKVWGQ